jgi:hypothetical protein
MEVETSLIPGQPPERRLRNYSLLELVRMQGFASKPPLLNNINSSATQSAGGKFTLMCQSEQKDTYQRFLDEGLPLESKLPLVLEMKSNREIQATLAEVLGDEPRRQDLMDMISWSYLWIRMRRNPNYYDIPDEDLARRWLSRMVDGYFDEHHKRKRKVAGRQAVLDNLSVVGGGGNDSTTTTTSRSNGTSSTNGKGKKGTKVAGRDIPSHQIEAEAETEAETEKDDMDDETDGGEADLEDNVRAVRTRGGAADDSDIDDGANKTEVE